MTRAELPILIAQLRADLAQLDRVVAKVRCFWEAAQNKGQSEERLAALAVYVHGFYNGLERIFDRIARGVDESIPQGPSSHRDLLDQMAIEVAGLRPAVLTLATRTELRRFLDFRHRVRHLYFFDLGWEDVSNIAPSLPSLWSQLRAELDGFLAAISP